MKAKPGKFNYGSSGNGTILHLAAAMFLDQAGVKATHVPYKGVGPMLTDLIGGQVDIGALSLPSIQQHLKSGALRAIGVGAATRLAAAPEIPTMVEQGMPEYLVEGWFAVIGPPKLPAAEVKRINAAFVAAFATPEVNEAMAKQGNTINVSTPEYAAQFFPQRAREVRGAREEDRPRAAVTLLRFNPQPLVPVRRPGARARAARRNPRRLARRIAAARRHLDRRDLAAGGDGAFRCDARPLSVHRLQGRQRAADRRRRRPHGGARGRGGRQALRQGLVARAQRRRRAGGRRAARDRRELRAHLPAERRQRRAADVDRLRADRAHRARRGDRSRGAARGARRARRRHPAARRAAALRAGADAIDRRRAGSRRDRARRRG